VHYVWHTSSKRHVPAAFEGASCHTVLNDVTARIVHETNQTAVDKANRNTIADVIERYLNCEIDNFELDDVLSSAKYRAAFELAQEVWFFYDDCGRHTNEGAHRLSKPEEARLRRWVLLLRSNHKWPIDEPDPRTRWYHEDRWYGVLRPLGCLITLILLPKVFFDVVVRGLPRPRCGKNEYWPLQSLEDWKMLDSTTEGK
jgi:hypothetical protein